VRVGVAVALRVAVAVIVTGGVTLPVGAGVRVPGRAVAGGFRVKGVPVGGVVVPVAVIVPVGVNGGVPGGWVVPVTVAVTVTVAVGVTVDVTVVVAVAVSAAVGVTVVVRTGVVVSGAVVANGALTGMVVAPGALPIKVTGNMGGRSMRNPPSGRTWITQPATRKSRPIVASAVDSVSRFMKPPLAINTLYHTNCRLILPSK
jgi:hypothetical protein